MIDLSLQNFVNYYVKTVMKIKNGYGYRVILKYQDGSEKIQQKAGFHSEKEAKKATGWVVLLIVIVLVGLFFVLKYLVN